ncbi:hypothetical protein L7F22_007451 [Adiantum nelumboides]|nr:hypothetical protein [Adiantum nelumboides]
MKHQKDGCNLVPKPIAFLFYLGFLIDTQPQDPQLHFETEQETSEAGAPISFQSVSTMENLDKAEKMEEEPIEEKESANLDVALFRATTVSLFNIREDYCIAAIAKASQVAKDFVDIEGESKEEFLSLDLETSNQKFLEAPDAFGLCLKRVAKEELALKDENFEARLVELGIKKIGRNIVEPDKISSDMGAKINLEHEGQIEADELQKIELLDEDNFLGRAGGSRVTSKYTGLAVIHYLPKLDKDVAKSWKIVQYHDRTKCALPKHPAVIQLLERVPKITVDTAVKDVNPWARQLTTDKIISVGLQVEMLLGHKPQYQCIQDVRNSIREGLSKIKATRDVWDHKLQRILDFTQSSSTLAQRPMTLEYQEKNIKNMIYVIRMLSQENDILINYFELMPKPHALLYAIRMEETELPRFYPALYLPHTEPADQMKYMQIMEQNREWWRSLKGFGMIGKESLTLLSKRKLSKSSKLQ